MKASGVLSLSANLPDNSRLAQLELGIISSGIACSRGSNDCLLLDVRAGVYTVAPSEDDSRLTLSANLSLNGYMKGERPLQQLMYSVGKAVPGVRWLITSEFVFLVVERLSRSTPEDDAVWMIGACHVLDRAITEVDRLARQAEHSLWHFANVRSVIA